MVASCGYMTFGDAVCSNVLNSYPRASRLVALVRVLIAAVVITSYPLVAFEGRRSLDLCLAALAAHRKERCGPKAAHAAADDAPTPPQTPRAPKGSTVPSTTRGGRPTPPEPAAAAGWRLALASRWPRAFISRPSELHVAASWIGGSALVALVVSDLGAVLGLVGASAGMLTAFVVPAACHVLLCPRWTPTRVAALAMLAVAVPLTPLVVAIELNLLDG